MRGFFSSLHSVRTPGAHVRPSEKYDGSKDAPIRVYGLARKAGLCRRHPLGGTAIGLPFRDEDGGGIRILRAKSRKPNRQQVAIVPRWVTDIGREV